MKRCIFILCSKRYGVLMIPFVIPIGMTFEVICRFLGCGAGVSSCRHWSSKFGCRIYTHQPFVQSQLGDRYLYRIFFFCISIKLCCCISICISIKQNYIYIYKFNYAIDDRPPTPLRFRRYWGQKSFNSMIPACYWLFDKQVPIVKRIHSVT